MGKLIGFVPSHANRTGSCMSTKHGPDFHFQPLPHLKSFRNLTAQLVARVGRFGVHQADVAEAARWCIFRNQCHESLD